MLDLINLIAIFILRFLFREVGDFYSQFTAQASSICRLSSQMIQVNRASLPFISLHLRGPQFLFRFVNLGTFSADVHNLNRSKFET